MANAVHLQQGKFMHHHKIASSQSLSKVVVTNQTDNCCIFIIIHYQLCKIFIGPLSLRMWLPDCIDDVGIFRRLIWLGRSRGIQRAFKCCSVNHTPLFGLNTWTFYLVNCSPTKARSLSPPPPVATAATGLTTTSTTRKGEAGSKLRRSPPSPRVR